ncbi:MAG: 50S ribosomal protein L25 [Pirellulales bacterium]
MSEALEVQTRETLGKRANRRLRDSGKLPAVLYGHQEPAVSLSLPADKFQLVLRHGTKLLDLSGAASGQALLQHLHWDPFGKEVLHVDLLRVSAGDRVYVEVPIEMRGESPGGLNGGIVELLMHSVEIEVSPAAIPDRLHIHIGNLQIGDTLTLADIADLPEGATYLVETDEAVVHCTAPVGDDAEEGGAEGATAEPEVIAKKRAEEEEAEKKAEKK